MLEQPKLMDIFHNGDVRGSFTKIFNAEQFEKLGFQTEYKEIYYSTSQKDVIRGMHFQVPPYDHEKLVHVISGSIIDVLVDLRKESPDFGKCMEFSLSAEKKQALYIPKGFAHGFRSLEDNTMMLYIVSTGYNAQCDKGIAYDSIGYDWGVDNPILSDRDKTFSRLEEFVSPF